MIPDGPLSLLQYYYYYNIAEVGNRHHHGFEIVIHSFIVATENPEENPDEHICLWEYRVSLISLQEITPILMNSRSY